MKNSLVLAELHTLATAISEAFASQVKQDSAKHKKLSTLFREMGTLCAEQQACPIAAERNLNALRVSKIASLKSQEAHPVAIANANKAYNFAVKEYFCKAYNQTQDDNDSDKAIYYYAVSKGHDACIWYAPQVDVLKPTKAPKQLTANGTDSDSESATAMQPNSPRTLLDQADDARSFLAALDSGIASGLIGIDDVLKIVANHQALATAKAVTKKVAARSVPVRKEITLLESVVVNDKQQAATGAALGSIGKAA